MFPYIWILLGKDKDNDYGRSGGMVSRARPEAVEDSSVMEMKVHAT